jgi:hypothetical protein
MRTGRLAISRGSRIEGAAPVSAPADATRAASPVPAQPAAPASPEYQLVHERLAALERLARLFEQGVLSAEEFAAEKRIILCLPADELVLRTAAPVSFFPIERLRAPRGPSLIDRLAGWKLIPIGLILGLAISFATMPRETTRFFTESWRLIFG